VPIPANSVTVDGTTGKATMTVKDLVMEDYFNIVNALQDGSSNDATVSFQVHWQGGGKHFNVRDFATGMAGEFIMSPATMTWSASSNGQNYVSGPEEVSFSVAGQVGHEHNGVFF